jgi:hypothetical protein
MERQVRTKSIVQVNRNKKAKKIRKEEKWRTQGGGRRISSLTLLNGVIFSLHGMEAAGEMPNGRLILETKELNSGEEDIVREDILF